MLAGANEALDEKYALLAHGVGFTNIAEAASEVMAISPHDDIGASKGNHRQSQGIGMSLGYIGLGHVHG